MTARSLSALVSRAALSCRPTRELRTARLAQSRSDAPRRPQCYDQRNSGGDRSLCEVERYTAKADQRRLARSAIARLPREQNSMESV